MRSVRRLVFPIIPFLGNLFLRLIYMTLRVKVINEQSISSYQENGKNMILAFWHGRQLFIPFAYNGKGVSIMISRHTDGELIARVMKYFGFQTARGSTTRGAVASLRQMIRLGKNGYDLAITPDGPKGPKYVAQMGVIEIAKMTGLPIYPLTFSASKKNS